MAMMGVSNNREIRIRRFLLVLAVFALVCVLYYADWKVAKQNTTALALSYRYGLIPRGLIGTVMDLIDLIPGISLLNYAGALGISTVGLALWYVLLFALYGACLRRCPLDRLTDMEYLIFLISVFAFPEFCTVNNFGRLDMWLWNITVCCLLLILTERAVWAVVLLCGVAALIHEGFVFTNAGIVLVPLLYQAYRHHGKGRRKYSSIFVMSALILSGLFIWFELVRQPVGGEGYAEIVRLAKHMSADGRSISRELLDSEILGKNVYGLEHKWHVKNRIETPIFVLFFLPYLILLFKYLGRFVKMASARLQKWIYICISIGALTILPELLLKVDFGRWMFCMILYYLLVVLFLFAREDNSALKTYGNLKTQIRQKIPFPWILLIYPLLFMPFRDVYISDITTSVMDWFAGIVGLW